MHFAVNRKQTNKSAPDAFALIWDARNLWTTVVLFWAYKVSHLMEASWFNYGRQRSLICPAVVPHQVSPKLEYLCIALESSMLKVAVWNTTDLSFTDNHSMNVFLRLGQNFQPFQKWPRRVPASLHYVFMCSSVLSTDYCKIKISISSEKHWGPSRASDIKYLAKI